MKLNVGTKILMGFIVVLLLTAGVASVGLASSERIYDQLEEVLVRQENAALIEQTRVGAYDVRNLVLSHVLADGETDKARFEGEIEEKSAEVLGSLAALEDRFDSEVVRSLRTPWNDYMLIVNRQTVPASNSLETERAKDTAYGPAALKFNAVNQGLTRADELLASEAQNDVQESADRLALSRITIIAAVALAAILGIAIALLIARRIGKNLRRFVHFAEAVGEGDLSVRLHHSGHDDFARLGVALNNMVERLTELTTQIRDSVGSLTAAAAEIVAASTQQTATASEQSAAVSQTVATVTEMTAATEQAAGFAREMAGATEDSARSAEFGLQAVAGTMEGVKDIRHRFNSLADMIHGLSDQTKAIGEITTSVNDLADQSNLLALNAAIEAARAGEAGKGFAVVAGEVRNLAEQSRAATSQVKNILTQIEDAVEAGVTSTEEATTGVEEGVRVVSKAGEIIAQLRDAVQQAVNAAQQIAASVEQQGIAIDQIKRAMEDINDSTVQSVTGAQQTQSAAENINVLVRQMETVAGRYNLNGHKEAELEQTSAV